MNPELSIIITSYKNPSLLKLCVEAIKKNIRGVNYEIIVVDGETEEETYDLIREEFPDLNFLPNEKNVGFSGLVNQGLEKARGDFFFIINSDIIIKKEGISRMMEFMKKNPDIGLAGPKLINFDNSIQQSIFRFYKPTTVIYRRTFLKKFSFAKKHLSRFLMEDEKRYDKVLDVDWIMGSAMMVSRQSVDKVGKMDDGFFMYFEDVDWCWRFWENKLRVIYYPMVEVYHYHGKQSANQNVLGALLFNRYTRVHICSAIRFFHKYLNKSNPHKVYQKEKKQKNGKL